MDAKGRIAAFTGNECVDWKPMFEFFNERTIPGLKDVRRLEFATASPGVSADCHWATIDAQVKPFELSTIKIDQDPEKRSFSGKTTNVARLALHVAHLDARLLQPHAQHAGVEVEIFLRWSGDRRDVMKPSDVTHKDPKL